MCVCVGVGERRGGGGGAEVKLEKDDSRLDEWEDSMSF